MATCLRRHISRGNHPRRRSTRFTTRASTWATVAGRRAPGSRIHPGPAGAGFISKRSERLGCGCGDLSSAHRFVVARHPPAGLLCAGEAGGCRKSQRRDVPQLCNARAAVEETSRGAETSTMTGARRQEVADHSSSWGTSSEGSSSSSGRSFRLKAAGADNSCYKCANECFAT